MRNTCSLETNGIYCRNQVGEIVQNKAIGPTLIINFHAKRQKSVLEFIEKKNINKLHVTNRLPIPMFYKNDVPAEGLKQFEADVLKQLWDKH